jgi:hypothetical protein
MLGVKVIGPRASLSSRPSPPSTCCCFASSRSAARNRRIPFKRLAYLQTIKPRLAPAQHWAMTFHASKFVRQAVGLRAPASASNLGLSIKANPFAG